MKSKLEQIFEKNRWDFRFLHNNSETWFLMQALELARVSMKAPQTILKGGDQYKSAKISPGFLYMFIYDPKHKKTLPYYDTFPLVLPFRQVEGGMYGLNLHYLPYKLRIQLLGKLMEFSNSSKLNEQTKLKFSWQLVSQAAKFAPVRPCVKHYLYSHVRSQFRKVSADDWATVCMLPVEQFRKDSFQNVWNESMKTIRKY